MIGQDTPYPELPVGWMIGREEFHSDRGFSIYYYGLEKASGKETMRFKSYEEALRESEKLSKEKT